MIRWLRLTLHHLRYINIAFWRNPASAFFAFVFPLIFLVIFASIFGTQMIDVGGQLVSMATFYIPAIAVFAVVNICFTNLATGVVNARDQGALKRIAGTPTPVSAWVAARVLQAVLVASLVVSICVAFGAVFYQVDVPWSRMPIFALSILAGATCFAALALALTCVIPNASAAPAITNAVIFPLLFISNVFVPADMGPAWVDITGRIFPVRPLADAAIGSFLGTNLNVGWDLTYLMLWALAGAVLAARFFRWQPRR